MEGEAVKSLWVVFLLGLVGFLCSRGGDAGFVFLGVAGTSVFLNVALGAFLSEARSVRPGGGGAVRRLALIGLICALAILVAQVCILYRQERILAAYRILSEDR